MLVFKQQARFHPITGKADAPANVKDGFVCDYCGHHRNIDFDRIRVFGVISYNVNEDEAIEAVMSQYRVEGHPRIDIMRLMVRHRDFHFCVPWDGSDRDCDSEVIKELSNPDFAKRRTIADILYSCRIRTVERLLSDGWELNRFDLYDARSTKRLALAYIKQLRDNHHNGTPMTLSPPSCPQCSKCKDIPSDIKSMSEVGLCGSCASMPVSPPEHIPRRRRPD